MPKVKKKRMGFVIDMTPLVDITFLLLTFLMFTAKFKSESENEQQFTIVRPIVSPDTTKLPERDLAMISVAIDKNDTSFYYGLTNAVDQKQVWDLVPEIPANQKGKKLLKVDSVMLGKLINATQRVRNSTRYAIDADKDVKFKWVQTVMNVGKKSKVFIYNFVTEKKKNQ